ncbi:PREDICTED: uncharacterized protein LOC106305439 isoform X2 [Brassica oleracea var. oleracea]|uniref:uncharacterized protein LOC106305439 isoform X2 n=1 Tax=Brassica oleracea var. oleracea TaxID=109376 RepID=UPI0006A70DCB|nr:PREDICTED: uncharacterized protein LOC106305439 isoform X2 [Brassica oleracea var. oleracea]
MEVLHSWTQHSNYYGEDTFKFILEDKMGSKIHCTSTGMYRPTSHKYKMSITWNSIVTNSIRTTCEVRLIDHNKESSSEDVSTSFSKHKEGDADLNDMNSTSKKLCAKNIKMGKTDED